GAKRIFVVPDGALHLLNFYSLPVKKNAYLVEQGPMIHYLSAERDLVIAEGAEDRGEGLLALGGADFDASSLFADLNEKGQVALAGKPVAVASRVSYRGKRSSCGDFQNALFEHLPSTVKEIEDISKIWQQAETLTNDKEPCAQRISAQASEAAFKDQSSGNRILHLATHGFFLGERCTPSKPSHRGVSGVSVMEAMKAVPANEENPLLLSGLVLAGANHRHAARPDEEDGILTAEEIAAMDLSGVEWAVLSACDTGVGEVRSGEGVFGLRRAFQVAGVRTLIMSFWSVEDEATRRWMKALYTSRFMDRKGTAQSVRKASLEMLQGRRARGESTHPFFWAGFAAAGDWR
ncbi:CHAT domain-containing protein, partial [Acidobacteriota bacterium]